LIVTYKAVRRRNSVFGTSGRANGTLTPTPSLQPEPQFFAPRCRRLGAPRVLPSPHERNHVQTGRTS
jgi:hypothetical protein